MEAAMLNTTMTEKLFSNEGKMPFVENKHPDMAYITRLLDLCIETNMWANRGPLYHMLAQKYQAHMNVPLDRKFGPWANVGLGHEALGRHLEQGFGSKIRCVGSSFSFGSLGPVYFGGMQFIGWTLQGFLDVEI